MSLNDNQEEFSILLEMGKEGEYGPYLSPKTKLFNMWAKRVPLTERAKIFNTVSPNAWKKLQYPASIWAFEQKLLFPDNINCPIEKLWPLDMCPPDNIPHLVLQRMQGLLETNASTKTIVEFVVNVDDNSNNWIACSKDPHLLQQINKIVSTATKKSPSLANALLTAFPAQLNKKITQLDTEVSASHTVVSKFLSNLKNPLCPLEQEFNALSQIEPSAIVANDDVVRKIRAHFSEKPFSHFKNNTDVLLSGKWKNKDIIKLCPVLGSYTDTKIFKEFLPFWLSNSSMRKDVKKVFNEKILEALNAPSKDLNSAIKWFKELSKAGVTQQDYNAWLGKTKISDPWGGLYDIVKRPKKLAESIEKNKSNMLEVFPEQLVGMLMVFKHLADQEPLDTTHRSLQLASSEEMEKDLEDSYYFSQTDINKLRALAIQLNSNIAKLNIATSITYGQTSRKSRKM